MLDWLRSFLQTRPEGPPSSEDPRGLAASAMLSLGLCSGSVLCILLTLEALLVHCSAEGGWPAAPPTDWRDMAGQVARLAGCCGPPVPPLPCGGATSFFPVLTLETPVLPPLFSGGGGAAAPQAPPRFTCIAVDGRYVYVLGAAGLLKYGSGCGRTLGGHLYASNLRYRAGEKAWLAYAGGRLYVRSPAMAPDALAVVDCDTLEEVGRIRPDGSGTVPTSDNHECLAPEKKGTEPGGGGSGGGGGGGGGGGFPQPPGGRHGRGGGH